MLHKRTLFAAVVAVGILCFGPLHAYGVMLLPTASLSTNQTSISLTEVRFDVVLDLTGDPGAFIDAMQLSVLPGDPGLTAGGTDFSRFTFVPSASTSPPFDVTPLSGSFDDAGFPLFQGVVLYDDLLFSGGLPFDGTYTIGELVVDLTGIDPPFTHTVSLAGGLEPFDQTTISGLDSLGFPLIFSGDPGTIDLPFDVSGATSTFSIPEPATAMLGLIALGGLGLRRRRAAR